MAENKTLFIVFQGDAWLSTDSLKFKGAYASLGDAIDGVFENNDFDDRDFYDAEDESDDWCCLSAEEKEYVKFDMIREALLENRQTQFGSYCNYIIDECTIGEWQ